MQEADQWRKNTQRNGKAYDKKSGEMKRGHQMMERSNRNKRASGKSYDTDFGNSVNRKQRKIEKQYRTLVSASFERGSKHTITTECWSTTSVTLAYWHVTRKVNY